MESLCFNIAFRFTYLLIYFRRFQISMDWFPTLSPSEPLETSSESWVIDTRPNSRSSVTNDVEENPCVSPDVAARAIPSMHPDEADVTSYNRRFDTAAAPIRYRGQILYSLIKQILQFGIVCYHKESWKLRWGILEILLCRCTIRLL